jgi:hypothetical protein
MRSTIAAAAFAALTLAGCGGGSPTGTRAAGVVEYDVYPTEVLVVEPGQSKDVKVTRKGGDMKDHDLTVTSSDPAVKVEGGKFKGDTKEATITVRADPSAPAKEHTVTIKSGDVTKLVKVRVEPAGGHADTPKGGTSAATGRSKTAPTK